jgi:hypothetical protein
MTRAEIKESIQARLSPEWCARNGIEPSVIDDLITDEYEKLVADTKVLEGSYTGVTDGVNPYMEINENIMLVKGVWYDYTAGSDWGARLEEITPLIIDDVLDSGDPDCYWIQGMHRNNSQRLYFNKLPAAGVTVRALFFKWPDAITDDNTTIEIKRLWTKAIKHNIVAHLCNMGKTVQENNLKRGLMAFELEQYAQTMKVINEMPKRPYSQATVEYRDLGV